MASMTCGKLERLVQALSTSRCFVSNFEISASEPDSRTLRLPSAAESVACLQRTAHSDPLSVGQPNDVARLGGGAPPKTGRGIGERRPGAHVCAANFGVFLVAARKKWRSRPISRVLSWTVIPLAPSPHARAAYPETTAGHVMRLPIWPCSRWGLPCRPVARPRCALTAPFHPYQHPCEGRSAVYFLLHFPSARAAQALPGTVPCGARTFLGIACTNE